MNGDFQPSEVDLIACGSTMGNLLRFIQQDYGTKSHIVKKSFRFLVEIVGNTVFFIRRENSPTETIPHTNGYWNGFMKKLTTPGIDPAGSTESHQRIVGYEFAGMNMLVRYEADGFLPHSHQKLGIPCIDQGEAQIDDAMDEDLVIDTQNLVLKKGLKVVAGMTTGVPLSALFDLKTRTRKSHQHQLRNILNEQLPRLWIRQLPYFIVAYQEPGSGCFHPGNTKISNVSEAIVEWEHSKENDLRKLVSPLNKIVSAVKRMPDKEMEVRCGEDADVLELRSQTANVRSALSTSLATRWCTPAGSPKEETMDTEMSI